MKVKINNKKHKIKIASELTVSEYIKLMSKDTSQNSYETLINYLSIITRMKYGNVADINISDETIKRIFVYIGEIIPVENIQITDKFYYKRTGVTLYANSLDWRTLGARKMLEDAKLGSYLEQTIYLLACYLSKDYDNDRIGSIYDELMNYNAYETFSFAFFFGQK